MTLDEFQARYQKAPVQEHPNHVLTAIPRPVISVLVSTYQHASFLPDCLEGILAQETDFPFEILIGEDDSRDGTREIARAYAQDHPDRIRLFLHRRENNIRIEGKPTGKFQSTYTRFMARGPYLALCEGDDCWIDRSKLQKQVRFLEEHPDFSLSCHNAIRREEGRKGDQPVNRRSPGPVLEAREVIRRRWFIPTASMVFRSDALAMPAWGLHCLSGDMLMHCLLATRGKTRYFQEAMSIYRIHGGGISANFGGELLSAWFVNLVDMFHRFDQLTERRYCGAVQERMFDCRDEHLRLLRLQLAEGRQYPEPAAAAAIALERLRGTARALPGDLAGLLFPPATEHRFVCDFLIRNAALHRDQGNRPAARRFYSEAVLRWNAPRRHWLSALSPGFVPWRRRLRAARAFLYALRPSGFFQKPNIHNPSQ